MATQMPNLDIDYAYAARIDARVSHVNTPVKL